MAILEYRDNVYIVNYEQMRNEIYKLLPIYEGRIKNSQEKTSSGIAYKTFRKNLDLLTLQIKGIMEQVEYNPILSTIYATFKGLKSVGIDEHEVVKNAILYCTNLIDELV